jgi:signal peptidase I
MSSKDPTSLPQPKLPPGETSAGSRSRAWWQAQRENLLTVVLALLLAFGIRTFVAEARWIPSDSMLPTLEEGDRLVVEKISYRFSSPRRGDIIVFYPPAKLNFDGAYIKRVIGLPGDRIRIADGKVIVNGIPLQEDYIYAPPQLLLSGRALPRRAQPGIRISRPPRLLFCDGGQPQRQPRLPCVGIFAGREHHRQHHLPLLAPQSPALFHPARVSGALF